MMKSLPMDLVVCGLLALWGLSAGLARASGEQKTPRPPTPEAKAGPLCISGIYPHLAVLSGARSECGIGAVVPWAGRLWLITYPAHLGDGRLWEVTPELKLRLRPESCGGTHASRFIHAESNQLIIGPYFIDAKGSVRAVKQLGSRHRLTGCMRHLTDPAGKVYFLTMEGLLFEADVRTLACRQIDDVRKSLGIRGRAHFKGGFTGHGRVIVANNSYDASDQARGHGEGRLAEWDGKTWKIIERTAFTDVTGGWIDGRAGEAVYAIGWDRRSAILNVRHGGTWRRWRFPKASQCYDHAWCTEWPRIREIAPGRMVMDFNGTFFDLPVGFRPGRTGGVRPIATHLRMIPDFCDWGGRLVLAADDNSFLGNPLGGQPQSNLWFGRPADLKTFGRPGGWGGVWWADPVRAGEPSDPFLLAGYPRKVVHLAHEADAPVTFTLETDAAGDGTWRQYRCFTVPAKGYAYHVFPPEFRAEWVRVTPDRDCTATAHFFCTAPGGPVGFQAVSEDEAVFRSLVDQAGGPLSKCDGAVLPWAGRLWFVANTLDPDRPGEPYNARGAVGAGLVEIDKDMTFRRRAEGVPGTFANRRMFGNSLAIGPHLIDRQGRVRTLKALAGRNVTAVMLHPTDKGKLCYLTEEGKLLAADPKTLEVKQWFDLAKELEIEAAPQFKGGYTSGRTMIVAAAGKDGRLGQWDGKRWSIVERKPFYEVTKAGAMSPAVLAVGYDDASAILKVRLGYKWSTYRLPRGFCSDEAACIAGWGRIREVQTERLLMDCGGLFYEMSELLYGGKVWGLRPICSHRRAISDFCSWRGLLTLVGTDPADAGDGRCFADKDGKVSLWFGKTDDLWRLGWSPGGRGGPWRKTPVLAGRPSDPYLMTGFDKKTLELSHDAAGDVKFTIEVDFLGTGRWETYGTVSAPAGRTVRHVFPDGFSAHWVRLRAGGNCAATATFVYR